MDQVLCLRGVPFKVKWTVKEAEPGKLAVMEGRGPARSKALIRDELEETEGGTKFVYVNEFNPPFGPLGSAPPPGGGGGGPPPRARDPRAGGADLAGEAEEARRELAVSRGGRRPPGRRPAW